MIRPNGWLRRVVALVNAVVILGCREEVSGDALQSPAVQDGVVASTATPEPPVLRGVYAVTPTDEAPRDSALVATRDSLLAIVARRDTTALLTYLDPNVKYSFGGDDGRGGFLEFWRTQYSLDAMWHTLHDALTHGGRFMGPTLFSAPWMYTALPDSLDVFEHVVVHDTLVPVRLTPGDTVAAVGTLSYTVVRVSSAELAARDSLWRAIILPDGRTAYVPSSQVRSPVDWRVGLGFAQGRWRIQFFVAGD